MSEVDSPDAGRFSYHRTLARARDLAPANASSALRLLREIQARAALEPQRRGRGPMAVFLPSGPAEGAALLRIHNLAYALRRIGWRSAVLPWRLGLSARRRYLAAAAPDVVVMQGARHPLNRPAYYPGYRIVYDMDDADFHIPRFAQPVTEAVGQVAGVIAGSRYIADWSLAHGARSAHVVWTGTPVFKGRRPVPQHGRPPVLAWAQTRPMHYTAEADMVRGFVRALGARCPGLTLRLYDRRASDDPAFAKSFAAPGVTVEWRASCDYGTYLASFADVALGVAPLCPETPFSKGKSFGKVLAYLGAGVPVLGSDAGEHGQFFTADTGVITNDPDRWVSMASALLESSELRQDIAARAYDAFCDRLSVQAAAEQTHRVLTGLIFQDDASVTRQRASA